jgi:hypothetical protein
MPTVSLYNNNDDHHQIQKFCDIYLNYRKLNYESQEYGIGLLTPTVLNPVPQGYDYYQRTGRKIIMKSIYVTARFNLSYPCYKPYQVASPHFNGTKIEYYKIQNQAEFPEIFPNAIPSFICELHDYVRILIVYDLQPNAKLPYLNQVLYGAMLGPEGNEHAITVGFTSFLNLNFRDRFKVIIDKRIALNTFSSTSGPIYTEFKELASETIFGTEGTITTGAVYMWVFGTNGYTNGTIRTRIRFIDA